MNSFNMQMMAGKLNFLRIVLGLTFAVSIAMVNNGCVKPANQEDFGPLVAASCSDGIMNQGEYRIDCGGPCAPCKSGDPHVEVTIDSTWIPDTLRGPGRFWKSEICFIEYDTINNNVVVLAVDSFEHGEPYFASLVLLISRDYNVGVHEIAEASELEVYVTFPPLAASESANMERGVITVTNRDDVNGLISGEFSFLSKPDPTYNSRILFHEGFFTDIPLFKKKTK